MNADVNMQPDLCPVRVILDKVPGLKNPLSESYCMKTLSSLCAALTIIAVPHAAGAHDAGLSKQHAACMGNSGGTTVGMIDCITAETKRQDAQLNKAYKALMAELSASRKTQLQEAQRAWIKYRDANCGFYYDPDGGTLAAVNANDCVMSATANRARELEGFKQ